MTASELSKKLTVIVERAKALRDAGVVGRVSVDDVSFEIGEAMAPTGPKQDAPLGNPLDDADTYGGHIPQRRVRHEDPSPYSTEDDDD